MNFNGASFFFLTTILGLLSLAPLFAESAGSHRDAKNFQAEYSDLSRSGNAVLLDVRTPEEFKSGYIAGATNLDFNAADFSKQIAKLPKDKTYFIYCRSGNRSGKAMKMMAEGGFKKLRNLSGGVIDWSAEKLPLIKN